MMSELDLWRGLHTLDMHRQKPAFHSQKLMLFRAVLLAETTGVYITCRPTREFIQGAADIDGVVLPVPIATDHKGISLTSQELPQSRPLSLESGIGVIVPFGRPIRTHNRCGAHKEPECGI